MPQRIAPAAQPGTRAMKSCFLAATCLLAAPVLAFSPAFADILGWCLPSDGGCIGPEPLTREGFSTCEEFCSLSNPVTVRGMKGILFDVQCRGDSSTYVYRMLFLEFADEQDIERALVIRQYGAEDLERCG